MFETVFSLQGRLKRLPYFFGTMALGLAFGAGLAAILVGGTIAATAHSWGTLAGWVVCLLPLVGVLLWCSLSLHVRRIRDIGWDPTLVIAVWLIFKVVDRLILAPLLHTQGNGTMIGAVVQLALSLALLFWPSHDQAQDDERFLHPGPPRFPEPSQAVPAPVQRLPHRVGSDGRVVFGRR
ncbi:hypothetical protein RHAL1_00708 [Beijerinckiaceae bacterium RH AL1]|nr:DUF805 domain-containing protein [Beijerinckiaceae bacterium]VVB43404.1 hypothetical protein RHAL8_00676 [Beijerinckiaceae bacterium RH AL8]VVB43419.1 hypothetical protein RHCH11_RHCH11_00678 [Beijerinckiaceae bacterium RH CH11]VVC53824.1 hypothetical protein RHAL1_00708 [Beijerinckiaceae bacterium RH AL1]